MEVFIKMNNDPFKHLLVSPKCTFKHLIVMPDCTFMHLLVMPSCTFSDVKAMIEEKTGIPRRLQFLHSPGTCALQDKLFLDECISHGDILTLHVKEETMMITIQARNYGRLTLTVKSDHTIANVKAMIEEEMDIPRYMQTLECDGIDYPDHIVLWDYGFRHGDTFTLNVEEEEEEEEMSVCSMETTTPDEMDSDRDFSENETWATDTVMAILKEQLLASERN
jgi:hypothetical protein